MYMLCICAVEYIKMRNRIMEYWNNDSSKYTKSPLHLIKENCVSLTLMPVNYDVIQYRDHYLLFHYVYSIIPLFIFTLPTDMLLLDV